MIKLIDQLALEKCPHCNQSTPTLEKQREVETYNIDKSTYRCWRFYKCNNCGKVVSAWAKSWNEDVEEWFPHFIQPDYDFSSIPSPIDEDFREALTCYSNGCYNAFASMCRRTVQSIAEHFKIDGSAKVDKQVKALVAELALDDETGEKLQSILITGHDGAHPHLPKVSPERANTLLEVMDKLLQDFFKRGEGAKRLIELRKKEINESKITIQTKNSV